MSRNGRAWAPLASVVIPTYGRGQVLIDTIEYLLANTYRSLEVIVVDQTPSHSEAVANQLRKLHQNPQFRYIRLDRPSLPLARNVGWRSARGDIIIYCDDDVIVTPDFVQKHVEKYTDISIGGVAGRIRNERTDQSPSQRPTTPCPPGQIHEDGWAQAYFDQDYAGEVDFGQGCNMSFRRDVLVLIGGFDERFTETAVYEEVDVFVRMRRAGYRAVFAKEAVALHLSPPTGGCRLQREVVDRYRSGYRNHLLYSIKNFSAREFLPFAYRKTYAAYAACRVNGYSMGSLFRIISGCPQALWAACVHDPHRLSNTVRIDEQSEEFTMPEATYQ